MVQPTSRTVVTCSSNYTPEVSKKDERSTTLVDLLVVEAIWIDQRSEVDQLAIMKIARSQAAIEKTRSNQKSSNSTVSQWSLEDSGSVKASIIVPRENELALVLDTLVRYAQCAN